LYVFDRREMLTMSTYFWFHRVGSGGIELNTVIEAKASGVTGVENIIEMSQLTLQSLHPTHSRLSKDN